MRENQLRVSQLATDNMEFEYHTTKPLTKYRTAIFSEHPQIHDVDSAGLDKRLVCL